MSDACEIHFLPDDKRLTVELGTALNEAALAADVLVDEPCGGHGRCGKCRVRFVEGAPSPSKADEKVFPADQIAAGWRLACQAVVTGPATVEVPSLSRAVSGKTFGGDDLFAADFEPALVVESVALDCDSMDEQFSLLERVARAAGRSGIPRTTPSVLRELARLAANRADRVCVVWEEDDLRVVAPLDSPECHYGVAIDLGTTTVAVALIDLRDGSTRAIHSTLNAQVQFGADVVSRITYAMDNPEGTARLQRAAVETVSKGIGVLCGEAGIEREQIVALSVVGNPTMEHLLLGFHPASLGTAPYIGAWRGERSVSASHVKLNVHPNARLWVAPMVRSNVGGDVVAAMLSNDMDRDERLRLLIDLGTNAEVVLGSAKRRMACSTAAGPAFEGASISQGMRAAPGAIDHFSIRENGTIACHVIGDAPARGICGSGLVDAVAELLRIGLIDVRGWLQPLDQCESAIPEAVARRIVETDNGHSALTLAPEGSAANGRPVLLTAGDVRQLQLVKGSIAAGTETLCREMGVSFDDLDEVLIAGAFGNYVRKESALQIGLVPPVDPERVRFVGNAAGIGARMMLADREARRRALALADTTEYIELAGRADYQNAFATAMLFGEL